MNIEQTAQQFELAAKILRTGHPWEWQASDGEWVKPTIRTELHHVISDGLAIRLALAAPPDGRQLHNPDNLTAEQVGVGWRLVLPDENLDKNYEFWCSYGDWKQGLFTGKAAMINPAASMRLPLLTPWPEAKPDPYADEKKTVPLGPEDVHPCSVFSIKGKGSSGWHQMKMCPQWDGLVFTSKISVTYEELMRVWLINRSIPLTGKWNPDAWEPCHKEVDA